MFGSLIILLWVSNFPLIAIGDDEHLSNFRDDCAWPNSDIQVYVSKEIKKTSRYSYAIIHSAIESLQQFTCLNMTITHHEPKSEHMIRFQLEKDEEFSNSPRPKQCEGLIRINPTNPKKYSEDEIKIFLSHQLGLDTQNSVLNFNDIKTLNYKYKCNATCIFLPNCKNGGYAHSKAPHGCGRCVCPEEETDCQDGEIVSPNSNHEMIKTGSTQLFADKVREIVTSLFNDAEFAETSKDDIADGAQTAIKDLLDGKTENHPADVTSDASESILITKLEQVFQKVSSEGGEMAEGKAIANILEHLKKGDLVAAIKVAISNRLGNYIGSAIGLFVGTAIGGPFGSVIGAALGAVIGKAVAHQIIELLEYLTPFFKAAWDWIKKKTRKVVKKTIVKPFLFLKKHIKF